MDRKNWCCTWLSRVGINVFQPLVYFLKPLRQYIFVGCPIKLPITPSLFPIKLWIFLNKQLKKYDTLKYINNVRRKAYDCKFHWQPAMKVYELLLPRGESVQYQSWEHTATQLYHHQQLLVLHVISDNFLEYHQWHARPYVWEKMFSQYHSCQQDLKNKILKCHLNQGDIKEWLATKL